MRRGTRVGSGYIAITADGSSVNKDIVDSVDGAGNDIDKAGDKAGSRYGDRFSAKFRETVDKARDKVGKALAQHMEEAAKSAGASAGAAASEQMADRMERESKRSGHRIGAALGDRIGESLAERLELSFATMLDSLEERLETLTTKIANQRNAPRDPVKAPLGDRIGGLLGAGSRNNFLNLIGKSIGNLINLQQRLSSGLSQLTGVGGEGASMLGKLSVGLSASAVAAGILAAAFVVLVSVSSALLALLTALVATVTSGLAGGLLVAATGFSAVAAAAGLLTVAFTSMTDAQRELLDSAFRPLKAELAGLGQLMLVQMIPAFETWSTNLQNALFLLAPLAQVMGAAFAEAGNTLTAAFSGPGFVAFTTALAIYLPGIVRSLSSALGSFLNGLLGVFAALMPLVSRFGDYLERVATRFSEWANSAQGQNSIVDFADRAVDSLMSLWNFTREFFGFLSDVLFSSEAQAVGNNMFDTLADSFAGFRAAIADGSLEKWFADAIEFGSALWRVMGVLGDSIAALYDSGVLGAVIMSFNTFADIMDKLNPFLDVTVDVLGTVLPWALAAALTPIQTMVAALVTLGETIEALGGLINAIPGVDFGGNGAEWGNAADAWKNVAAPWQAAAGGMGGGKGWNAGGLFGNIAGGIQNAAGALTSGGQGAALGQGLSLGGLISSGTNALNNTSQDAGGWKVEWVNPYIEWANAQIKDGPTIRQAIRRAMKDSRRVAGLAIREALQGDNLADVRSALGGAVDSLRNQGASGVDAAQANLNTAYRNLANASTPEEAAKALRAVKRAQKDLAIAQKAQARLNKAAKILDAQQVVNPRNVQQLLAGFKVQNATLADYAVARERLAVKIEEANEQLAAAIAMRDEYKNSVTESVKSFGSLLGAQAKVIDGIEQALTFRDITSNLEDRLAKIRTFNENLRKLLAMGLSNDAYQQLVDAGVDQGGAYAEALVQGGQGAVGEVNNLVGQINTAANTLGTEASQRLYQAGVNAAQGLVDGLNSLSSQLDSAAARLGESIAQAIRRSLGIKSPAQRLIDDMEYVGDGAVIGLRNQYGKVSSAAAGLADQVAISPSLAARYAAGGVPDAVSGNSQSVVQHHWHITTPTEDPEAVAKEAINEMTARMP